MKSAYETPSLEVEEFVLSTSIASHCAQPTEPGPAMGNHTQCEGWKDDFGDGVSLTAEYNVTFYDDDNCNCYTTGNSGYWTS